MIKLSPCGDMDFFWPIIPQMSSLLLGVQHASLVRSFTLAGKQGGQEVIKDGGDPLADIGWVVFCFTCRAALTGYFELPSLHWKLFMSKAKMEVFVLRTGLFLYLFPSNMAFMKEQANRFDLSLTLLFMSL